MCMRDEGIRVYNIIVGMYDINLCMKYEVIVGKSDTCACICTCNNHST